MTPLLKKEMMSLNVPKKKHFSREYFEETTLTTQRERERESTRTTRTRVVSRRLPPPRRVVCVRVCVCGALYISSSSM